MISSREVGSVVAMHLRGPGAVSSGQGAGAAQGAAGAPPPGQVGQGAPVAGAGGADHVVLSAAAQIVSGMVNALRALPDTRPEVVARVQARMASGAQPTSRDVARQMLGRALGDRLGAGSGSGS